MRCSACFAINWGFKNKGTEGKQSWHNPDRHISKSTPERQIINHQAMAWENENELQAVNACWTQLFKYLSRYDMIWNPISRRILQDLWISLGLIFDSQIAGLLEYHAWSYGLMQDSPCCVPLDPLQINLCEFDHTLEISLVSFFGVHPSIFFNPNHNHLLFSACLPSRMFSPIHPYSVWPALSLQVCVCEQDPFLNQKLHELMQIFVGFLIQCQKHPRLQNTAMLLFVSL